MEQWTAHFSCAPQGYIKSLNVIIIISKMIGHLSHDLIECTGYKGQCK